MDDKYWDPIIHYISSIDFFISAYKKGILSREDYIEIEKKVVEKSGLSPLSVYRIKIDDIK